MTSPTHTRGPWEVGPPADDAPVGVRFSIRGQDPEYPGTGLWHIADVCGGPELGGVESDAANAHLIAAAPTMLAVLEDAYDAIVWSEETKPLLDRIAKTLCQAKGT